MKLILVIITSVLTTLAHGQSTVFKDSKNWKLYDIADENAFEYRLDTLKHFSYEKLDIDTMHVYMTDISELHMMGPQIWMGAYIATFESEGVTKKLEISHYGGLLYDETSKKHYQIAEEKANAWLAYIRQSYMAMHKSKIDQ